MVVSTWPSKLAADSYDCLLRLTASRLQTLRKQARLLHPRGRVKTFGLCWRSSFKERMSHPDLPSDAELPGRLHEVQLGDSLSLCLVTSLTIEVSELADLYRQRNDAEIDIRKFKVVLNSELSRVKKVEMFQKELWMSMVNGHVVCQFRREAVQQAQLGQAMRGYSTATTRARSEASPRSLSESSGGRLLAFLICSSFAGSKPTLRVF